MFGVLAAFFVFFPEREIYLSIGFTRHRVPAIEGITLIFFVETAFAVITALAVLLDALIPSPRISP
ncbi:hypothetical protein GTO27_07875 [Candidatus Bathyarchaeota archaeon]|nr:hypothetical protein [Candidatus Bathyarchaeota archaeon]